MSKRANKQQQGATWDETSLSLTDASNSIYGNIPDSIDAVISSDNGGLIPSQDGTLNFYGCVMSNAGLIIPETVSEETFLDLQNILFSMEGRIQVYIGDLLVAAERLKYGEITSLAERYGFEPKTLFNWKSVCSKVKTSSREEVHAMFPNQKPLGIAHYTLLQSMDTRRQKSWMKKALEGGWSVKQLRDSIRQSKNLDIGILDDDDLFGRKRSPDIRILKAHWLAAQKGDEKAAQVLRDHINSTRRWLDELESTMDD